MIASGGGVRVRWQSRPCADSNDFDVSHYGWVPSAGEHDVTIELLQTDGSLRMDLDGSSI